MHWHTAAVSLSVVCQDLCVATQWIGLVWWKCRLLMFNNGSVYYSSASHGVSRFVAEHGSMSTSLEASMAVGNSLKKAHQLRAFYVGGELCSCIGVVQDKTQHLQVDWLFCNGQPAARHRAALQWSQWMSSR